MAGWVDKIRGLRPGRGVRRSLADFGTGRDPLIWALMILSPAALGAGISLPILRLESFSFFGLFGRIDHRSIAETVASLWAGGDYALAVPILLFAAVFPCLRLMQAWRLWRRIGIFDKRFGGRLDMLRWLGWWSLAEIVAVALFILHVTYRGKTDALTEPGLYLFAAGIAGIALAQILIGDAALRLRGRGIVEYSD